MFLSRLTRLSLTICGVCTALLVIALGLGRSLPADRIIFLSDQDGPHNLYELDIARRLIHKLNTVEIAWSYALASDSQHILYAQTVNNQSQIFIMDVNGKNNRKLVDQPGINPAWSPDSQYIAFTMLGQDKHPSQIYRVSADGRDLKQLTDLPDTLQPTAAFWSPDGSQILFQVVAAINKFSLYVMSADGTDARPFALPVLFDALVYPVWSPDGRYIAFVGESVNSALALASTLCVAEVATAVTQCFDSNIYSQISWSPDSASIAFVVTRGYNIYEIRILDILTAQMRSIQRYGKNADARGVSNPLWTPDGQHLIYAFSQTQNREWDTQLHIIHIDGSGEHVLTSGGFTNILPTLWKGE
jgi:TolB protein